MVTTEGLEQRQGDAEQIGEAAAELEHGLAVFPCRVESQDTAARQPRMAIIVYAWDAQDHIAMKLPPFKLDLWLAAHEFATPPIRFNLASSTGPIWKLGELMGLGDGSLPALGDLM